MRRSRSGPASGFRSCSPGTRRTTTRRRPAATPPSHSRDHRGVAGVVGPVGAPPGRPRARAVVRPRAAFAGHAQGAHVRADRRDRGRADHVTARVARRGAQLGLPLLLAARRHLHAPRADERAATARRPSPSATGCCARSRATRRHADHVRRRRASGGSTRRAPLARPATRGRRRCASATRRPSSSSSTCTARYGVGSLRQMRRLGSTAATRWARAARAVDFLESAGASPTRASGRCAAAARHFTHSKVMAWVAFDRAVQLVDGFGLDGSRRPLARRARRDPRTRCARAASTRAGHFTQSYGATALDASVLMIPLRLPPRTDPRILGTVAAIERELIRDGFVSRYTTRSTDRRTAAGGEGAFLACSFWLVDELRAASADRRGARAVRAAARPAQRRRPARRGVRPGWPGASSATSPRRSPTWRW